MQCSANAFGIFKSCRADPRIRPMLLSDEPEISTNQRHGLFADVVLSIFLQARCEISRDL